MLLKERASTRNKNYRKDTRREDGERGENGWLNAYSATLRLTRDFAAKFRFYPRANGGTSNLFLYTAMYCKIEFSQNLRYRYIVFCITRKKTLLLFASSSSSSRYHFPRCLPHDLRFAGNTMTTCEHRKRQRLHPTDIAEKSLSKV